MEQLQQVQPEQEVILEKSIGNLFEEFLESKGRTAEFETLSQQVNISIDGEFVRLTPKGFPATVAQVLRNKVLPTQELRFHPAVAGG
jgi:hypothetical protein